MGRRADVRLKVLVDAVSAHTGGGLTYAFEQLHALGMRRDLDVTVLSTEPLASWLEATPGLNVVRRPRVRLLRRIVWEQVAIPVLARDYDVVYMIGNFAALGHRGPQVVTFQNPFHFGPDARCNRSRIRPRRVRARLLVEAAAARASARRATRGIAVSEVLRRAIEQDVGPRPNLCAVPSGAPLLGVSATPTNRRSYVFAVANDYPHKDWDLLLDTFLQEPGLPPLVIVGRCRSGRRRRRNARRISRVAPGKISLVGAVEDRGAIATLYSGAVCLLAHSRLEAFPLTPYEAFALHVPVVASDIRAHREVCGSSALYYDPTDAGALADAVRHASGPGPLPRIEALRSWTENAATVAAVLRDAAETAGLRTCTDKSTDGTGRS